jgi:DNA-binding IclR family transcriptional regulator
MSVLFSAAASRVKARSDKTAALSDIMDAGIMLAAKTQSVPALERALSILESLSRSKHGLTLSQLARTLELPKSSVHCLLLTFERHGYLRRDENSGRYRLGLRLCDLANVALGGVMLRDQAAPYLNQLRESTQLTTHLAVLEQDEVVLIEKIEPLTSRINSWVGKRMDVHCTALGKALTAYLPEEQVEALVRRRGMLRHNDNTIATFRRLKEELEQVRKQGYSVDDEEEEIGVRCLGAAILNANQQAIAAVSITGTTAQIHVETRDALVAKLRAAAAAIAAAAEKSTGLTQ